MPETPNTHLRMPHANNCAVQARAIKACCHYIQRYRGCCNYIIIRKYDYLSLCKKTFSIFAQCKQTFIKNLQISFYSRHCKLYIYIYFFLYNPLYRHRVLSRVLKTVTHAQYSPFFFVHLYKKLTIQKCAGRQNNWVSKIFLLSYQKLYQT